MDKTDTFEDVGFLGLLPVDCRATRASIARGTMFEDCRRVLRGVLETWKHHEP